ncbi:MAG: hypothetical protein IKD90_05550 [Clostridiales bacterium]|nr:hypothetical protein [Clostridiales bacterium]
MLNRKHLNTLSLLLTATMMISMTACSNRSEKNTDTTTSTSAAESEPDGSETEEESESTVSKSPDRIATEEEISNSSDGEHAIEADGESASYSKVRVTKTGDSEEGDEADFYGDNAAIFATNGATLDLSDIVVDTDGKHANAVFSYGEGTTVNISNSEIRTSGNCSGGLMTTGGGTMNAENLTIHTTGNSSAAIRSDRGGGTVTVTGGSYTTDGKGSPVIYSTADITVNDAKMESTSSQGVVVEGRNSVTLNNVSLVADNNSKNSDKSSWYQAVMIYQSMSGDAAEGEAAFSMKDGSLTNKNGDIFFVNNTVTTITLENVEITNQDSEGVFLRAAAAGWGSEGANGGKVNLYLKNQKQDGDILVDSVSAVNMYLTSGSTYQGAIDPDNEGKVYVEIESGSKWILTGDSYVTSLTCDTDAIDLNGHTLYVDGVAYGAGTASTGEAITLVTESSSDRSKGGPEGGDHDAPPSGEKPKGDPPSGKKEDS